MKVQDIQQITVVGAGLMGHGIAQEFALAGYRVQLTDVSEAILERARETIQRNLDMLAGFGLITREQAASVLPAIHMTNSLADAVAGANVVVEAVYENIELKQRIFRELDAVCAPDAILASNTSTFLPSKLAEVTNRPAQVLITHYFNPPFLLPLVEIVRHADTSDETVSTIYDLLVTVGKKPAIIQKEVPGFIGNRIQGAVLREALWLVEQGIATPEDIDNVIRSSIGRRWAVAGVFEVFEIAGWELVLNVAAPEPHQFGSSPEEAVRLIREKVARGELGVKTGQGFYEWDTESTAALRERIARALIEIAHWD
jgi:3-hydroxybutyryl-CoA dehydrogenase